MNIKLSNIAKSISDNVYKYNSSIAVRSYKKVKLLKYMGCRMMTISSSTVDEFLWDTIFLGNIERSSRKMGDIIFNTYKYDDIGTTYDIEYYTERPVYINYFMGSTAYAIANISYFDDEEDDGGRYEYV